MGSGFSRLRFAIPLTAWLDTPHYMCVVIQVAFNAVQASAIHINRAIQGRENREKIAHIQQITGVKLIKPSREYIREGVLSKVWS